MGFINHNSIIILNKLVSLCLYLGYIPALKTAWRAEYVVNSHGDHVLLDNYRIYDASSATIDRHLDTDTFFL